MLIVTTTDDDQPMITDDDGTTGRRRQGGGHVPWHTLTPDGRRRGDLPRPMGPHMTTDDDDTTSLLPSPHSPPLSLVSRSLFQDGNSFLIAKDKSTTSSIQTVSSYMWCYMNMLFWACVHPPLLFIFHQTRHTVR